MHCLIKLRSYLLNDQILSNSTEKEKERSRLSRNSRDKRGVYCPQLISHPITEVPPFYCDNCLNTGGNDSSACGNVIAFARSILPSLGALIESFDFASCRDSKKSTTGGAAWESVCGFGGIYVSLYVCSPFCRPCMRLSEFKAAKETRLCGGAACRPRGSAPGFPGEQLRSTAGVVLLSTCDSTTIGPRTGSLSRGSSR